jgi:hypothetical protein
MDAAKLTRHMVIALSNETWCRTYSVGAIASGVQWKTALSVVAFGATGDDTGNDLTLVMNRATSLDTKMNGMLAKQAPKLELRALGCPDAWIPVAIEAVMNTKAIVCAMDKSDSMSNFLDAIIRDMPAVPLRQRDSSSSKQFFSSKGNAGKSMMILSDQSDVEAVAASRVVFRTLMDVVNTPQGARADTYSIKFSQNVAMIRETPPIQDVDLTATEFADIICAGRVPMALFLATERSFQSASQLLRLGFMLENIPNGDYRSYPVSISDVFAFPPVEILDAIASGQIAKQWNNGGSADIQYTTKQVSPKAVISAVSYLLQHRMYLCNVPRLPASGINTSINYMLTQIGLRLDEVSRPSLDDKSFQPSWVQGNSPQPEKVAVSNTPADKEEMPECYV